MAGNLKLKAGTHTAAVTSGGSVTDGHASVSGDVNANLANSTNLDQQCSAVLVAAAGSAPTEGNTVSLYLVPIADGTNAAAVDTSTPYLSPNYFVGNFNWPAAASASAQRMTIEGIPLEAYDYKPYLVNNLGQTLSSAWTLDFYGSAGQYT